MQDRLCWIQIANLFERTRESTNGHAWKGLCFLHVDMEFEYTLEKAVMNCKPSEGLKIKTYRKSRIISGQYNSSLEIWILPSCLCSCSFAHCLVPDMLSWALLNCHAVTVTSQSIPTPELSELLLLCDLSSPTPALCSSFLNSYYVSRFQLWWHQNWGWGEHLHYPQTF